MLVKIVPASLAQPVEIINLDCRNLLDGAAEKLGCHIQLIRTISLTKTDLVMLADDEMLCKEGEPNARAMTISRSAQMLIGDIIIVAERYSRLRVPTGILLPYPFIM